VSFVFACFILQGDATQPTQVAIKVARCAVDFFPLNVQYDIYQPFYVIFLRTSVCGQVAVFFPVLSTEFGIGPFMTVAMWAGCAT